MLKREANPSDKEYVVVGRRAVGEALESRREGMIRLLTAGTDREGALARLGQAARFRGLPVERVGREEMDRLAGQANHQGVALVLEPFRYAGLDRLLEACRAAGDSALVVLADHLEDPHNLGAVIRSAAAAGALGVVIPSDRSAGLTPAVAKAAAGALERLLVTRVTNLSQTALELKDAGLWVLAAATRGAPAPWDMDLDRPLALVVGSEHKGVGRRLAGLADMEASIPLARGVESLNASVAAGVMLFEVVRQRAVARKPG